MSLSPEQMSQLASLADALKGTTIEDLLRSNVGHPARPEAPPAPVAPDTKPTPEPEASAAVLGHLQPKATPAPASASVYLEVHSKNYIQRDVNTTHSSYVPSAMKLFFVLNLMDTLMSQNYYARRSLPGFFPTTSRLYFAILFHIQLYRVMYYMHVLPYEQAQFLEHFLESFPPETLPIPGPLLPFFQSLCVSTPENKRLRRVFPTLPANYFNATQTPDDRMHANGATEKHIPFIPLLAHLHHALALPFAGRITFGADDSHSNGNKNVTRTPIPGIDQMIDLLNVSTTIQRLYFPFEMAQIPAHAPNARTEAQQVQFMLFGQGPKTWNGHANATRQALTNCGIAEPIQVHRDLVTQFKQNFNLVDIPSPAMDDDDFNASATIDHFFLMHESQEWFANLAAQMTSYSTFWPASGTLADCSLEGPRTGQYIAVLQAPPRLPTTPTRFADPSSLTRFDHKLTTTVSEEEPVTELLARYAATNVRLYGTHPWMPTFGNNAYRQGPFWDVRPLHTNGTTDGAWIQTNQVLKSTILDKPLNFRGKV